MEEYLKNFKYCLQKEIPYCAAECPFHLDMTDFIEKMKRGGFRGAFKTYRDAVGFPMIASALCHEPCKAVCPRKATDSAVELLLLEKACISLTADRKPTDYNLPMKKKKIAVIGAGISGLACALRLCMKKYEVEIFEATGRMGGSLWDLLEPEVFLNDIEEQFQHEDYVIHFYSQVESAEALQGRGFDAVYVATGNGGADFGLMNAAAGGSVKAKDYAALTDGSFGPDGCNAGRYCKLIDGTGWFAGGGLIGEMPVYALANGLNMGTVIDNFLKTGRLHNPENIQATCMQLDPAKLNCEAVVSPADGSSFDAEEAKMEAARCLACQCDFCRSYCDLTDYFSKWPLRIRDEIMATTLPGSADVKATPAKRLLSTCNQCGLCKEVCPEDIDLGGLILEGRKSMHRQNKAPWVFHDFWLRDMDFANSEAAALVMVPPDTDPLSDHIDIREGSGESRYAFFPGCQLGSSDPELVKASYRKLLEICPDTGLLLRCCGAPAEWSGDEDKFVKERSALREAWTELGSPELILACPTCEKKFKTYLPDIPVISLYEFLAEGVQVFCAGDKPDEQGRKITCDPTVMPSECGVYSVFDACAARHEPGMKRAVRKLAEASGCRLEPLPKHDQHEQCCGYGGQPGIANPKYAEFVVQKRIEESSNPYITYCINCRDAFLDAGKEAYHILELSFGAPATQKNLPTVSQRRENRSRLKRDLMAEFWKTECETVQTSTEYRVSMSESLVRKISKARILEEDLIRVIDFCERTGRKTWLPDSETYSGYKEVGNMTYWVEYRVLPSKMEAGPEQSGRVPSYGASFELINAYSHRMRIELEGVWNGKKTTNL